MMDECGWGESCILFVRENRRQYMELLNSKFPLSRKHILPKSTYCFNAKTKGHRHWTLQMGFWSYLSYQGPVPGKAPKTNAVKVSSDAPR